MSSPERPPGKRARDLVRASSFAALSTLEARDGMPYGSLVMVASDHDAAPLLLISQLAVHTRNILADSRASLLFDQTRGHEDRLAGARATVSGNAIQTDDPTARERFCARHINTPDLLALDFHLYKVNVDRGHFVGGFGDVYDIAGPDLVFDVQHCADLIEHEAEIVEHMNSDHAEAIDLYANVLLDRAGKGWHMIGCDPEGCDLHRKEHSNEETARLSFEKPVHNPEEARAALVALVNDARQRSPS